MSSPPPLPPSPVAPPLKKGMSGWVIACIIVLPVLFIVGILASIAVPAYNGIRQTGLATKSLSNIRQVELALRVYATDHDGAFPAGSEGKPLSSSQEAFNLLIPNYIDTEQVFWNATGEPDHLRPPREDENLQKGECIYGYASGQNEKSSYTSPLVFEGFLESGFTCSPYMPGLNKRRASVGFVDGSVRMLPLTSSKPGATISSDDRSIKNIFFEKSKGGLLDTKPENVCLPIGYP